jgi:hypothetical protein
MEYGRDKGTREVQRNPLDFRHVGSRSWPRSGQKLLSYQQWSSKFTVSYELQVWLILRETHIPKIVLATPLPQASLRANTSMNIYYL